MLLSRLFSGFGASEAGPGVGFLSCRPSCWQFFSLIDFRFCLSSLAQQGFVFPICSIWCGLHAKGVFSGCVSLSGRAQPLIPALDPSGDFHFPL
jgi:hypothetical protein